MQPHSRLWLMLALLALGACATKEVRVDAEEPLVIKGANGIVGELDSERLVRDMAEDAPDPRHMHELFSIISSLNHGPIYKDSRAELLIDGPATFAVMLEAIAGAQQQIDVETYIFADDEVGNKFADALIERCRAGVRVRVIYDSFGSLSSGAAFFDRMKEAGIEVVEFHAVNPAEGGSPLSLNVRDHRKLLIVDNTVAFTGGINFSDTYTSSSSRRVSRDLLEDGWRDTHVAVYGPAIEGLRSVFESNWREHAGDAAAAGIDFPTPQRSGNALVATLMSEGGNNVESPIARAYQEAFDKANLAIWIMQAYFVPDEAFLSALTRAAGRGVDVRLIVPGVSDSAMVLNASRYYYARLLAAGIRLCEDRQSFVHAKTAVIDGLWSTVGTSNLDMRSFVHNDEINVVVFGAAFGRQMEQQFQKDLEDCVAIDAEQWAKRPITGKVKEQLARMVAYWL